MYNKWLFFPKSLTIFAFAVCIIFSCPLTSIGTSNTPMHIEADRMISQEEENSVVFFGNVDARQGDITIHSEEMTVYYTQKGEQNGEKGSSQVKHLICKKGVEIVQEDWLGTGKEMEYFADERKVILSGEAKAWQGQNMISGKTITYYLDDKRSVVEQDATQSSRVKAVLYPEEGSEKK